MQDFVQEQGFKVLV